MDRSIESVRKTLSSSISFDENDIILIVTDNSYFDIGQIFYHALQGRTKETFLICMEDGEISGQEPPHLIAELMKSVDIVLCVTKHSLTHTQARINASQNGTKVVTLPGITKEMLIKGAMTADYNHVAMLTKKITERLSYASIARIEKDGHSLTMDLNGRKGVASTGIFHNKGDCGNLPSGEAYIAPIEDRSHGTMMIDGSMVGMGKLQKPLIVTIENGKLTNIKNDDKNKLEILLENDKNATLGELGIGTNDQAILCGIILEDEKIKGTVHIAFGTNTTFGGNNKADCHLDGVILEPDLYLDDELIIQKGQFLLKE